MVSDPREPRRRESTLDLDRLRDLFLEARERRDVAREAFLDEACGEDVELRRAVESLLAREGREVLPTDPDGAFDAEQWRELHEGETTDGDKGRGREEIRDPEYVGPYRILGRIGEGGMGVVYRAEQESPKRLVALKVIRKDHLSRSAIERFGYEVSVLGLLQHPGIARIYDARSSSDDDHGPAYFAMELVQGETLLDHARKANLSIRQKLSLFAEICDAVHYAHQKSIVHRDLKPGNILVDEAGRPKILDFGIAKSTEKDVQITQTLTTDGQVLGTPAYMSPEQAAGNAQDVDTRSDQYALGVVLYELLSGRLPYTLSSPFDAARVIQTVEADRLSSTTRRLRGDVETIVSRVLEKDRSRRYASVADLAEDIRRYLRNEPIVARPASTMYRVRKFTRRHQALVLFVLTVFALLILAFVVERVQRNRADLLAARALCLASGAQLDELLAEGRELWPRRESEIVRFDDWIRRAESLAESFPTIRRHSRELREEIAGLPLEDIPYETRWLDQNITGLVSRLDELTGEVDGMIAQVRARRALATEIESLTIDDHGEAWEEAIAEIYDHPDYDELILAEMPGLVPLEADPQSGLWEFWLYESGERPERDPQTGKWIIEADTGMVLVLIPGGTFYMGAQMTDPDGPNFENRADRDQRPPHEVTLGPFLLSKYEMTQSQWSQIMAENPWPSINGGAELGGEEEWGAHPVENIDQGTAQRALHRFGLTLPTEAQWEYATRAGTDTAWWTGNQAHDLKVAAFCHFEFDQRKGRQGPHQEVGLLAANAFGLHDVHGNVWEWCADDYWYYDKSELVGEEALRVSSDSLEEFGVCRGGSFAFHWELCRSSWRYRIAKDSFDGEIGIRPCGKILREVEE